MVRIEWRPARWSVCLPLIIFPCTIRSRSSILAPAHPGGPGKRAVKRLWWCGYVCYIFVFFCVLLLLLQCLYIFHICNSFDGPTVSSLCCTLPYVPGFANLVRDAGNADRLLNVLILLSVVTFLFVFSVRALPCSKCPCLCLIQCLHLHVLAFAHANMWFLVVDVTVTTMLMAEMTCCSGPISFGCQTSLIVWNRRLLNGSKNCMKWMKL